MQARPESEPGAIKGDKRLIVFLTDSIDNERERYPDHAQRGLITSSGVLN